MQAALALADEGIPVFPCLPGRKTPATGRGFKDATCDRERIRELMAVEGRNLAFPTGKASGIVVLDEDAYKPGAEDSLVKLEAKLGALPETKTIKTRAGGHQFYFRAPEGLAIPNSAGKLAPGIDVRGDGGYVVAAPSWVDADEKGPAGFYTVEKDLPLAELPARWLEAMTGQIKNETPAGARPDNSALWAGVKPGFVLPDAIPDGQRNDTLWRYLGHLLGRGTPWDLAERLVRDANALRCKTPLDDGELELILRRDSEDEPEVVAETPTSAKGDILNGQIYARLHGGRLRWVHELGCWLEFNEDGGWTHAKPEAELVAFKGVVSYLQQAVAREVAKLNGDEISHRLKRLMSHAEKSCTIQKARAGIDFAKSEDGMTVRASELDANPMHLGLVNGVLDLKTFQLMPYAPGLLVTKRARARFDLAARCPLWQQFLKEILPDPEVRKFVREFFGYVLTGRVDRQLFLFLYGTGANGKSVFIALLAYVLGEYARRIPTEMLMAQPRSSQGPSPDIMLLKGLRLAYANETEEGARLGESRIKDMTSMEPLTGREPYGSFVTFNPSHSLVIVGNHRPIVHDDSWGMWRRMCQIPFEVTIPPAQQDSNLFDKLIAEADGILCWMLRGLRDYQRGGLQIPESVQSATQAYREDMDIIGDWLADCCALRGSEFESKSNVFSSYREWAEKNGYRPMTANSLTRRLKNRGILLDNGRRNYQGIAVKAYRPPSTSD